MKDLCAIVTAPDPSTGKHIAVGLIRAVDDRWRKSGARYYYEGSHHYSMQLRKGTVHGSRLPLARKVQTDADILLQLQLFVYYFKENMFIDPVP